MADRLIFAGVLLGIMAGSAYVFAGAIELERERERYMAECTQHHRTFECASMWQSSQPQPIVVHVHGGRR